MSILYNNTDITSSVQPTILQITDNAGGIPDSLTIVFSDTEGLWSKWKPAKNDTLQVKESGFDTGLMYIDELAQTAGRFGLKALSIPQNAKTARSKAWDNVRFMEIVTEIAGRYGFGIQTFNIINHFYERLDQIEQADFMFLDNLCLLEGYILKINNKNLVIYDESKEEQKVAVTTIYQSDMQGDYEFRSKSTDIYGKSIVRSLVKNSYIQGEYADANIQGPTLKKNMYASNQAEANRWAKGILRGQNKFAVTGSFYIDLNLKLAAGIAKNIQGIGLFDGKYFIDRLLHDLMNNRTKLTVRKPLEGY